MASYNKTILEQKKIAAVHEAGHAAIFHMLGNEINRIIVSENGDGFLECTRFKPSFLCSQINEIDPIALLKRYGLECLSGPVAEYKLLKKKMHGVFVPVIGNSHDGDVELLYSEMEYYKKHLNITINPTSIVWELQRLLIEKFNCKKVWNGVLTLADELCNQDDLELDGDDVHYILENSIQWGEWQINIKL